MPRPRKILVDECVPSRVVQAFVRFLRETGDPAPPEVHALQDFRGRVGEKDQIWIPEAKRAGFDLVITGDKGNKKRGDKFPEICEKCGLRHVLLGPAVRDRGADFMRFALLGSWPNLLAACDESGLKFTLVPRNAVKDEVGQGVSLLRKSMATSNASTSA